MNFLSQMNFETYFVFINTLHDNDDSHDNNLMTRFFVGNGYEYERNNICNSILQTIITQITSSNVLEHPNRSIRLI